MSPFLSPLILEFVDGRTFIVREPFEYQLEDWGPAVRVRVPDGFHTDFASVPRLFWALFPPSGPYGKACVIHDKLYADGSFDIVTTLGVTERRITRATADRIFAEAMQALGIARWQRWLIWASVRCCGWRMWARYRASDL